MSAKDNTGANNGLNFEANSNENVVINVNRDNEQSRKSPTNKNPLPDTNIDQGDKCADNQNIHPANKSSNRNTINFLGKVDFVI